MLSYRHVFHAGNFADVLKHVVLTAVLRYLTRKEAPLCYIDTHAGAGSYDLQSGYAKKTAESDLGIARIWDTRDAPEPVAAYLELVRRCNHNGALLRYPGSPWLAAELLRAQDRLLLCELHGSDFQNLQQAFKKDRRAHCYAEDGYRYGVRLLPPAERRGLLLMDPSYEMSGEYEVALAALGKMYRRFATGTYALWYPILDEHRTETFRLAVETSAMRDVLHLAFQVAERRSGAGMYGCGMILVNPPWTLRTDMELTLPWLAARLGANKAAKFRVEQWVAE